MVWLNCDRRLLRANQDSPEIKSLYFHETRKMSAEYNLYSYISNRIRKNMLADFRLGSGATQIEA